MNTEKKQYQIEYEEFINNYSSSATSGESVGLLISRLAQYYADANSEYAEALYAFNKIASIIEESTDGGNGKTISSAKAKVLSDATPEAERKLISKATVENIDQMINALKSLQKGILNEYSHMANG